MTGHAVHCDRHGCDQRITTTHDATERQLSDAARALGWQVKQGTQVVTHHCPRHAHLDVDLLARDGRK